MGVAPRKYYWRDKYMYDVAFIGFGAAAVYAAYELVKQKSTQKIAIIEKGKALDKRKCPIDGVRVKSCVHCKSCSIMEGAGGAGSFSDGKYNITTNFGGDIAMYLGDRTAYELMWYVDKINTEMGGAECRLFSTSGNNLKYEALKYDLHLLDASVRHLGTDKNYEILTNIIAMIQEAPNIDLIYNTAVESVERSEENGGWIIRTQEEGPRSQETIHAGKVVIAAGRSGSKWASGVCEQLGIPLRDNRVDIGVRVELPAQIWKPVTDQVYESKLVYRDAGTRSVCRTFCMNPYGYVVTENTNGILTVNGHSFEDEAKRSENTNFALLVTHHFTEPFHDSNAYGESIARLTNMLSGGVMLQRFGDLLGNRRTNRKRMQDSFTKPTLDAEPGNLELVFPKLTLDTIINMIERLDKLVPGTANTDTLLYGTEVKFYNSVVNVDNDFHPVTAEGKTEESMYIIGDCSGTTHSLSQAAAEGVFVARELLDREK